MHRAASEALFNDQTKHLSGELLEDRNWRVIERAFPVLDVLFAKPGRTSMRVRMTCDDWNDLPPSILLCTAEGVPLGSLPTGPTNVFNSSSHPKTSRPFICMAGSREYHTHDSHLGDPWDNYKTRGGYDIGGILTQIWSAWLKSQP